MHSFSESCCYDKLSYFPKNKSGWSSREGLLSSTCCALAVQTSRNGSLGVEVLMKW